MPLSQRPRRIILHPGFHRTGTSSIHEFLWTNRVALTPHVGVVLPGALEEAVRLCTGYSRDRNPLRLADLVDVLDRVLAEAGLAPETLGERHLILSAAGLAGQMPGGNGVTDYAAVPITCAFLTGYLAERYPGAEVRVLLTTRRTEEWLASIWRHQVVHQRQAQGWPAFGRELRQVVRFAPLIKDISEAVAPAKVWTLPLEQATTHAKGPGGAVIELLGLPDSVTAGLIPAPPVNKGPEARLVNACLRLNQSDLPLQEVRNRKAALLSNGFEMPERRRA